MGINLFLREDTRHVRLNRKRVRGKPTRAFCARLMIVAVVTAFAASCSVADYKEPISDLQTAVEISINTVSALDAKATAVQNARWRASIAAGTVLLSENDGQCADGATTCTLQINFQGDAKSRPYPAVTLMPKAKIGLEALRTYVGKLRSIVDADTVGKVTTAANAALGSVQEI